MMSQVFMQNMGGTSIVAARELHCHSSGHDFELNITDLRVKENLMTVWALNNTSTAFLAHDMSFVALEYWRRDILPAHYALEQV